MGPILSVKRTDAGVITVTLAGYLPKVAVTEKLAQIRKLQSEAKTDDEPQPEYSFVLSAIFRRGFMPADPEFGINVYIDVIDSAKLQGCIQNAHCIEDFVNAGAVEVGTMFSMEFKLPMPVGAIGLMNESSEGREVMAEIERNLPGIMMLLKQATPVLQVHGKGDQVDVKGGLQRIGFDRGVFKPPAELSFSKDISAFSGLILPETGMKSDYATFLKDLKFKKPVIDPVPLGAPMKNKQQG